MTDESRAVSSFIRTRRLEVQGSLTKVKPLLIRNPQSEFCNPFFWCYHPHAIQSESRPRILMKHKLLDIARRLLILLLVVWTVVSLVTILIELVPGDPAVAILGDQATPEQIAQFRRKHGLDRPAFFFSYLKDERGERYLRWNGADNRYVDYWSALLHGDMGRSFRTDRPVVELILSRYGAT